MFSQIAVLEAGAFFPCSVHWLRFLQDFVATILLVGWGAEVGKNFSPRFKQGCIFRFLCSHRELCEDHVLTSAYVKIFRTVTRNAVNKSD